MNFRDIEIMEENRLDRLYSDPADEEEEWEDEDSDDEN